MNNKVVIGGEESIKLQIEGACTLINTADGNITSVLKVSDVPAYDGQTVYTPSREAQTVLTANKLLKDNITIEPIPSNYGLVTWNGQVLTVS